MRCARCGHENTANTQTCSSCGVTLGNPFADNANPFSEQTPYLASIVPTPQPPIGDNAAVRMLIPVGRSVHAIIAGYLGLLSLGFCFLGPFAILFGILAIRDIRQDSSKHGMVRAIIGIVLGTIGCLALVLAIASLFFE